VPAIVALGASLGLAIACGSPSPTTGDPGWNGPEGGAPTATHASDPPPPPPDSNTDDAGSPQPMPTTTADAAPPPSQDSGPPQAACGGAQKACGNECVSIDDPNYGCLDPSCAACNPPNAIAMCTQGSCAIQSCKTGWADCNGDPSDGCEANLLSTDNCGACGNSCSDPHALLETCVKVPLLGIKCVGTCNPGWADCGDGVCDVNIENDPNNCGQCNFACGDGQNCVDDQCQ
jgi:hypothetical protein